MPLYCRETYRSDILSKIIVSTNSSPGHSPFVMSEAPTRRFLMTCRIVCVIGILNFVIFVAIAFYLEGDAVNGKVEGGRYYLFGVRTEAGRKVYTEVSEPVFNYSKWHAYSFLATWPLVMAAGFAANRKRSVER